VELADAAGGSQEGLAPLYHQTVESIPSSSSMDLV
jgi:hypothetical protein